MRRFGEERGQFAGDAECGGVGKAKAGSGLKAVRSSTFLGCEIEIATYICSTFVYNLEEALRYIRAGAERDTQILILTNIQKRSRYEALASYT